VSPVKRACAGASVVVLLTVCACFGAWMGLRRGGQTTSEPGTGATGVPSMTPGGTEPGARTPPGDGLAKFYDQTIAWHSCKSDLECGTLTVPLDYDHPDGATLSLGMELKPAADQSDKVGPLLVNPGGPGAMATELVDEAPLAFGQPLLDHFDIIGLNPRGTTGSSPVDCLSDKELDAMVAAPPAPDTPAEVAGYEHWTQAMGAGCERSTVAAHVSTVEAARDMDVLRSALGQSKLDYLGFSYGTDLGTTYADLFPHRVGRFVLDGAMDPGLSPLQLSLQQAKGFQTALDAYVRHCFSGGWCTLGATQQAALDRIHQFLADTDAHPVPTNDSARPLTAGYAYTGIGAALYDRGSWSYLTTGLEQAFKGNGTVLLALADLYTDRQSDGTYASNLMEANAAITCLDHPWSVPASRVPSLLPRFEKASPTFGADFAWSTTSCSGFHDRPEQQPPPVGAPGASPIVVIGTTRDPATPYAWAKALAAKLDSGVLVTRDGDGHTGYDKGNSCVDGAVEGYLVDGKVPRDGLTC
jgi:pimeloyl-ACP methyl ester carboxylesterase